MNQISNAGSLPSHQDIEAYGFPSNESKLIMEIPSSLLHKIGKLIQAHKIRIAALRNRIDDVNAANRESHDKLAKISFKEASLLDQRRLERDQLQMLEKEESEAMMKDNEFFKELGIEDAQNESRTEQLKKEIKRIQDETKKIIAVKIGSRSIQQHL